LPWKSRRSGWILGHSVGDSRVSEEPPGAGDDSDGATEIRAFLIADVRGYTLFTQERGDEAAAKLAKKFAVVARDAVEARRGSVIELRGDEALAVFGSPRQAIRAAVDLQERFVEETISDPSLPLTVGIGLDAGEAVPVEGGYRGGALNQAARLCGLAGAGEILASQEMEHLARRVEGIRYEDRGDVALKGIDRPVRVIRVISERGDPAVRLAPYARPKAPEPAPPPRTGFPRSLVRGRGLVALIVALAVVAAAIAIPVLLTGGGSSLEEFAPDSVGLIDVNSGSLLDSVDLGARPQGIALGYGAAWVTHPTTAKVSKIDTKTRKVVDTIPVGLEPAGIAVGVGAGWVANSGDGTVSRIDPDTADVVPIPVGNGPNGVAVGFGSVWVVNAVDGTLARVDPGRARVTKTAYVGDGPTGIAVGDDALWVTNSAGATVSRIAPGTMAVVQSPPVGNGPGGLAALPDRVWVANNLDASVSKIDPETTLVIDVESGRGPSGVAAAGGAIWVANELDGTVSRIDPATDDTRNIALGNPPTGLAATGDALWVTVGAAATSHRGGTLRIVSKDPVTIDPALAYSIDSWQIFAMTNDGLVGFRKVSGSEGFFLVPDLAISLPQPTGGGKTYTFQIRPDIRYSTGAPVRPEDFRRAIERVYTTESPDGQKFYNGIVGADRCMKEPSGCDLSEGIETTEDTVTFRLERPDPDFLYKLALSFAYVVPADTPGEELKEPLPATGPYKFASYDPRNGFELVRNPYFREWSPVAQPGGYPDRIVWRFGVEDRDARDQVIAGEADWFFSGASTVPGLAEVRQEAPELVHSFPLTQTLYMSLGTTRPPFDDPLVRRALNLAVDRGRVVELFGGTDRARPTCQVLPPNFPGYAPYCPYTVNRQPDGDPDLVRAQELVRRAGARGMKVEVWGFPIPGVGLKVTQYITGVLNDLGLRAKHKAFSDVNEYFDRLYTEAPQIAFAAWGQDYPNASNFFVPLLSCNGPQNSTGFCDPEVDRMIERALALQAPDPPQARELWAAIDRRIVDLAPWAPLMNPVGVDLVSPRVGNYQQNPQWGLLLDQLWVK
jgi:ABC-type transport system substrate-binding protein/class 3 adenylate cyclase